VVSSAQSVVAGGGRRAPAYDKDLPKHYVRMQGWLPPCMDRKTKLGKKRDIRYFTLCAAKAIDVFMLERAKVLKRTSDNYLHGVWFCEGDSDQFQEINRLIRTPERGFPVSLEDMVLFEPSVNSGKQRSRLNPGGRIDSEGRAALRLQDHHDNLLAAFPFDIINLDLTRPLFPRKQPVVSRLMRTILRILDWQMDKPLPESMGGRLIDEFTLFLTVHVDEGATNRDGVDKLTTLIERNIDVRGEFRHQWAAEFSSTSPAELAISDFERFLCLGLPKLLIERGIDRGWDVISERRFLYKRLRGHESYTMMCQTFTYKRPPKRSEMEWLSSGNALLSEEAAMRATQHIMEGVWGLQTWADKMVETNPMKSEVERDLEAVNLFSAQIRKSLGLPAEQGDPVQGDVELTQERRDFVIDVED